MEAEPDDQCDECPNRGHLTELGCKVLCDACFRIAIADLEYVKPVATNAGEPEWSAEP